MQLALRIPPAINNGEPVIVLFTDFGCCAPYVGQMKAVLVQAAPAEPIIDLCHDAPTFDPHAAGYLLAAYVEEFPAGTVFLGVVDPGVGSARRPVMLQADARWYVGPDNGLFEVVAQRARTAAWHEITWRPAHLSASFHGRDLFAPVAAGLACGRQPASTPLPERPAFTGPEDLPRIVYIDSFGNAMTGLRAARIAATAVVVVNGRRLSWARTFAEVPLGQGFWYANANGLIEIAINQGRADRQLGLAPGMAVMVDG